MNVREAAAWEVHEFCRAVRVPYAIIGGMAVQHWGEPRFTQDVDLTVSAPLDDTRAFVERVLAQFSPRLDNALEFALRNRVILVQAGNGCPLDIALGLPGYEDEVMRRAVDYSLEPGKAVRLCCGLTRNDLARLTRFPAQRPAFRHPLSFRSSESGLPYDPAS